MELLAVAEDDEDKEHFRHPFFWAPFVVFGDDVFIVRIPDRWSKPETDQLRISLLPLERQTEVLPDKRVRFLQLTDQTLSALQEEGLPRKTLAALEEFKNEEYEEFKFLDKLTKKVGTLSEEALRLISKHVYKVTEFHFEGLLDKSDILDQRTRRPIAITLSDSSQATALLLEVDVEDVEVGKNILDKSLEKSGEVLESASKLYDKFFSDGEEQPSESGPTAKFEPRIVFARKELKTSNACYAVNDSVLEKQSECSF